MKSYVLRLGLMAVVVLAFSSCASSSGGTRAKPLQFYEGAALPLAQASVLRSREPAGFGGIQVRLNAINGKPGPNKVGWGNGMNGSFFIELAPGEHTLSVGYSGVAFLQVAIEYSTTNATVSFTAEPGHDYVLDAEISGDHWRPTLRDASTGKMIY